MLGDVSDQLGIECRQRVETVRQRQLGDGHLAIGFGNPAGAFVIAQRSQGQRQVAQGAGRHRAGRDCGVQHLDRGGRIALLQMGRAQAGQRRAVRRVDRQRRPETGDRLVQLALLLQGIAQIGLCLREPRVHRQRLAEPVDRFVPMGLFGVQAADIAVEQRIRRPLRDGLGIAVDRLAAPAEIGQQVAQADAGRCQIRFQPERLAKTLHRVQGAPRRGQGCRQRSPCRRIARRQVDRAPQQPDRLAGTAGLGFQNAGQMRRAGLIRVGDEQPAAGLQRRMPAAGAIQADRLGHCRGRSRRVRTGADQGWGLTAGMVGIV